MAMPESRPAREKLKLEGESQCQYPALQPDPDQSSKPSPRHFSTVDRFIRGEITLDEYVRLAGDPSGPAQFSSGQPAKAES